MGQAVSGHAVIVELQIQSHTSPREVYSGQSSTGTGFYFSLSSSVLPCQHYSANAQHSFIHSSSIPY